MEEEQPSKMEAAVEALAMQMQALVACVDGAQVAAVEMPKTNTEKLVEANAKIEKMNEEVKKKEAQDWAKHEGSGGRGGGGRP